MNVRPKNLVAILFFFVGLFTRNWCYGHDWPVHVEITGAAYQSSSGLQTFLNDNLEDQILTATQPQMGGGYAPIKWLEWGSKMEDEQVYTTLAKTLRPVDHFYTVVPYRTPGQVMGITDKSEPWPWGYIFTPDGITNSYAWGSQNGLLGPSISFGGVGTNAYNWLCARNYEWTTLTNAYRFDRDENMALMLYALGHVLHLNQDLSQPDHVRNDNHYNEDHRFIENYGVQHYMGNPQWFTLPENATVGWANWQSQGFNKFMDFWDRNLYKNNSSAGLVADANGNLGAKLGLAEFSNGNFIGEDALYKEVIGDPNDIHYFPFPSLNSSTTYPSIRSTLTYGVGSVLLANGLLVNRIYVKKNGDGIEVDHHSVVSYLGAVYPRKGMPLARVSVSINDANVLQDLHSILLPKAVEYSTGILDYFFRGTISAAITDYNTNTMQYTVSIQNTSSDDFHGGTFFIYQQDTNNVRTYVMQTNLTSTLASGDSTAILLQGPTPPRTQYICIYRGNIGVDGSGNALDPVDANLAIAATTFDNHTITFDMTWDNATAEIDMYLKDPCDIMHYEEDLGDNPYSDCCKVTGGDDESEDQSQHMVVSKCSDGNFQLWVNFEGQSDVGWDGNPVHCTLKTTSAYSGLLTTETFTLQTPASGQNGDGWPTGVTGPAAVDTNGVPSTVNASWYVRKAITISNGQPSSY